MKTIQNFAPKKPIPYPSREVQVYLGEGIWWRTRRDNLPRGNTLPVRD